MPWSQIPALGLSMGDGWVPDWGLGGGEYLWVQSLRLATDALGSTPQVQGWGSVVPYVTGAG